MFVFISETCKFEIPHPSLPCYGDYSEAVEERASYVPEVIKNDTLREVYETLDAWKYTPSDAIRGEPLWAEEGYYQGGGYVANFDINREISIKIIKELKDYLWLDRQTRALMIEFTTFNPNVNLFAYVSIVAEFPPSAGVIHYSNIQIIQGYALGFFTVVVYICGVLTILFALVNTVLEIKCMYKTGKAYWKSAKNCLSCCIIINVIAAVVCFALRMSETTTVIKKMNEDHTAYVPFRRVAQIDEAYKASVAFLNALCFLKFILLMRVYHRIANLLRSLAESSSGLKSFFVCFGFALLSYTSLGYLLFCSSMKDYRSLLATVYTLINVALGAFDTQHMMDSVGEVATILFFTTYVLSIMFIMVNLMVAIICEGQVVAQENPVKESDIDVILEKLWPQRFGAQSKKSAVTT